VGSHGTVVSLWGAGPSIFLALGGCARTEWVRVTSPLHAPYHSVVVVVVVGPWVDLTVA